MDPTEIVLVPYNLQRLLLFVTLTVLLLLCVIHPVRSWPAALGHLILLSTICFGLFILCGASPYENVLHTALASTYFVTLGWSVTPIFEASTTVSSMSWYEQFRRNLQIWRNDHNSTMTLPQKQQSYLQKIVLLSCIACTIPLQVLLLFDRGWQWQRWPIPVILGSTFGYVGGTILASIYVSSNYFVTRNKSDTKKMEKDPSL